MEWRVVASHPAYEVSSTGLVRRGEKVLKNNISNGYVVITPCTNGIQSTSYVHRLVAEAFIPNPENKCHVDHINRIRNDNRVENLRWATRSENLINTNNQTKHRHIYPKRNGYKVQIQRNNRGVFYAYFITLDEAIIARDLFLLFL